MAEILIASSSIRWHPIRVSSNTKSAYHDQCLSTFFFFCFLEYDRLYRTGDFASMQKGGCIIYEGRTDSQIKIRGYRIDLTEIEKNVLSIDGIDKAIVLCYHAGEIDQALLSFVTLSDDATLRQESQLEHVLKSRLADYMVPQIIIIDTVPLLVNGKVDRQSLLKMYENTNNNGE